jgi:hypothetical protein
LIGEVPHKEAPSTTPPVCDSATSIASEIVGKETRQLAKDLWDKKREFSGNLNSDSKRF